MEITIGMEFEKETKRTYRYKGVGTTAVETLYIKKEALSAKPNHIKVVITST